MDWVFLNMTYKMFKKIKNLFREKEIDINLGMIAIVTPTDSAINSFVNSKFTKNIIIYEGVRVKGDKIKYGRKIEEIPYTEEEVFNLTKIKKIPVAEKKFSKETKFEQESPFGEIIN